MPRWAPVLSLCATLAACGRPGISTSSTASRKASAALLVFALGGHDSCASVDNDGVMSPYGNAMAGFAGSLASDLRGDGGAGLVTTCFREPPPGAPSEGS